MKKTYVYTIVLVFICLAFSCTDNKDEKSTTNSIGMTMRLIESGTFLMGCDTVTENWNEWPVHKVSITKPFYISESEVTIEMFQRFRSEFVGTKERSPYAAGVSWYDAMDFCEWLSNKEGKNYRLPTEAEWEYACRLSSNEYNQTTDNLNLGNVNPNPNGLKNMLSHVREWCLDWHEDYTIADQADPVGPQHGVARIVRGGGLGKESSKNRNENFARPSHRAGIAPSFGASFKSINKFGYHNIGFRVVQAPMPKMKPTPYQASYVLSGIKQNTDYVEQGPNPEKPYLRKRYMLPTPPDNSWKEEKDAVGQHPSFMGHNHSPAMEVCPNGDILMIIYTSYGERDSNVSLIANRLRFGSDQWDMPSPIFNFPSANDHAPELWNDNGNLYCFWGNPNIENAFPFQWTTSTDNGANWSEIRFPNFKNKVGKHSKQPINTAFRNSEGTMYVACDGGGSNSVLWSSNNNGKTWYDTEGRSGGRHTTYVLLKDGSILGMGGKDSNIDGYMPKSISHDGGKTWTVSKTPFSTLGANQRPSILRLASGRLLFATDFQRRQGFQPEGITQRGALVALSEDEGQTWHIKKLSGAQLHEDGEPWGETIGYSVARQAPNGVIHLITSMNNPCLHFEMNEAWILDAGTGKKSDDTAKLMMSNAKTISDIKNYKEKYPNGKTKLTWNAGVADNGSYLLHGPETWYYENGRKQREAEYQLGQKIGTETFWSIDGKKLWNWQYNDDGTSIWTQWWPTGTKKARSSWRNFMCEGTAILWDLSGNVESERTFLSGHIYPKLHGGGHFR
jgi:formylglycine-generating enzyme required for sulfatase activity